jgi:hypothetical protein
MQPGYPPPGQDPYGQQPYQDPYQQQQPQQPQYGQPQYGQPQQPPQYGQQYPDPNQQQPYQDPYAQPQQPAYQDPYAQPQQPVSGNPYPTSGNPYPTSGNPYPPAPGYGAQPGYGYPAPQGGQNNTLALIGMILGIASIPTACCYIGLLLGGAGIVLGVLGQKKANELGGAGKGQALAGIVCGAVGVVVEIAILVLAIGFNTFNYGTY